MNIREALQQQAPSLALQRSAADEIARLDLRVANAESAQRRFDWLLDHLFEINGDPSVMEMIFLPLHASEEHLRRFALCQIDELISKTIV